MAFERDLGYLDKFFDNLEAHAGTLDGDAGARLAQLVGEERVRWAEIRGLLGAPTSGGDAKRAAPEAKAEPEAKLQAKPEKAPEKPQDDDAVTTQTGDVTAAATRDPAAGFTVGSLRGR